MQQSSFPEILVFDGSIVTQAPFSTTSPNSTGDGIRTPKRMPRLWTPLADGVAKPVPYIPGSGIRGKLRRQALAVVTEALAAKGPCADGRGPFTLQDYYFLAIGGVRGKGSEDADKSDFLKMPARRAANPLASLFGAGNPWISARLAVGHAVPTVDVPTDLVHVVRGDDFRRDPGRLGLLAEGGIEDWLDRSRRNAEQSLRKKDLKKAESAAAKARRGNDAEALAQAETARKAKSAEVDGEKDVSVMQALVGYEVLPAGRELRHRMTLRDATPVEVGLLLAAIDRFAMDPILGGHVAQGFGLVSAGWQVKAVSRNGAVAPCGSVTVEPHAPAVIDGEVLGGALAAWREAAERIDGFDFSASAKPEKEDAR